MSKFGTEELFRHLADSTVEAIQRATAPLHERIAGMGARIAALEGRPPDDWQAQRGYAKGAAVGANGTIWIAARDNAGEKPGTGDAWRLA